MSHKVRLDYISALTGPPQVSKITCDLPEPLLVVLCGTLAGAHNFVEIDD